MNQQGVLISPPILPTRICVGATTFRNSTHCIVAYPDLEKPRDNLFSILAISRKLTPRDWEEQAVLKTIQRYLTREEMQYEPQENRIVVRHFIGPATFVEDRTEGIFFDIVQVPAAVEAFQNYQRERDKKAPVIAAQVCREIPYFLTNSKVH